MPVSSCLPFTKDGHLWEPITAVESSVSWDTINTLQQTCQLTTNVEFRQPVRAHVTDKLIDIRFFIRPDKMVSVFFDWVPGLDSASHSEELLVKSSISVTKREMFSLKQDEDPLKWPLPKKEEFTYNISGIKSSKEEERRILHERLSVIRCFTVEVQVCSFNIDH